MTDATRLNGRLEYEAVGRLISMTRLAAIYGSFGDRDPQTNLPNRQAFHRLLSSLRVDAANRIGVIVLDIDHLRLFNDAHGRGAGDAVVLEVARQLEGAVNTHRVFRIGSDEFAVVLDGCSSQADVDAVAAHILDLVSAPHDLVDRQEFPTLTLGGCISPLGGDVQSVLRDATFALCHAQDHNRGGYIAYRPELRTAAARSAAELRNITTALQKGQLVPYYQPLVDLRTSKIIGVEALVRLRTEGGVIIGADKLAPALQNPDLAPRITDAMFDGVAQDVADWIAAGIPFKHVGVNLAPADLADPRIEHRIFQAFDRANVPLKHVVLEITECVYLDGGNSTAAQTIKRLRKNGLLVALDDFGTGYASLTHLLSLPVDIIKLDKSFVQGMSTDRPKQMVVAGIIDIAKNLGMRIVAEGIEQIAQAEMLREMGAVLGQGFLFSRPVDAFRMMELLTKFGQGSREARMTSYDCPVGMC